MSKISTSNIKQLTLSYLICTINRNLDLEHKIDKSSNFYYFSVEDDYDFVFKYYNGFNIKKLLKLNLNLVSIPNNLKLNLNKPLNLSIKLKWNNIIKLEISTHSFYKLHTYFVEHPILLVDFNNITRVEQYLKEYAKNLYDFIITIKRIS